MKRVSLVAFTLLLASSIVFADTIQTKTGETFKGRVLEETHEYVRIRSQFGELSIPRAQLKKHDRTTYVVELKDGKKIEGQIVADTGKGVSVKAGGKTRVIASDTIKTVTAKRTVPAAKKLTPQQVRQRHLKGMEYFKKKNHKKALAEFLAIVKSDPTNGVALYNCACAYSLMKDKANAVAMLTKSAESGWVNFQHMEQDTDLDGIRNEPGYKALLAKKAEYIKNATVKTVARITEGMKKRGVDVKKYKNVYDRERNFVYLHTKTDADLAVLRKGLEDYAGHQWKHLLQNKPTRPLYIVLLSPADSRKVLRGRIGGVFQSAFNTLFCGDMPTYKLMKTSVVVHEFTHALHFADMYARKQRHPIWLIEGLATLFESSDRNGKVVPLHSYRLRVVQAAIRTKRTIPWRKLMSMQQPEFLRVAQLAYAQSRYMLFYMHEKGLLKKFYDEYTNKDSFASDKTALASFEVVFGKPIETVEREWKTWALAQKVPPIPFLGISTQEKGGQLVVRTVSGKSPAAKAGIKVGDVVTAIGERVIGGMSDLMGAIGARKVGDEIEVTVKRKDKDLTLKAKLASRRMRTPRLPARPKTPGYLGLAVEEKDGKLLVREVAKGSPAEKAKIAVGTEVVAFNGKTVKTVRDYLAALRKTRPAQKVRIRCKVGEKAADVAVRLQLQPRK
jgi:RNase P/RNase MRP subunit p29